MGRQFKPGQLQTGSLYNISSSYAVTASYAANAGVSINTGSLVTTASFNAFTASYTTGSFTGSFIGNGSGLTNLPTQSFDTGSFAKTGSNIFIGNQTVTGSLNISGSTTQIGVNNLLGQTNLSGSIYVSGSMNALADLTLAGTLRLDPAQDPGGTNLTASFLFTSASNTEQGYDLYYRQDGNLVKFKWLEGGISSGLLYGGKITSSGSMIYVSSGSGVILDPNATFTKEINPQFTYVTWANYSASATFLTSSQNTYIYVDSFGVVRQQTSFFDQTQYEQAIPLGRVTHPNFSSITGIGSNVQTTYDSDSQQSAFVRAFGPLKVSGFSIQAHAGSLSFGVGSGIAYTLGGFYSQDPNSPSHYNGAATPTASIARAYRSGSGIRLDNNGGTFYTTVDPDYWDDGTGVLNTMATGDWQIQRVFFNPVTGRSTVYYGQNTYTTLLNALQYLATDSFTEGEFTANSLIFIGYLVLKGQTNNIADTNNNRVINGGIFRNIAGGSSGAGAVAQNLDDLSDVTTTTPSNGQALIYNSGTWINGTPSLASTASYVLNAVSASYAPDTTFPYSGSARITGSLGVTGSFSVYNQNANYAVLDTNTGTFRGTNTSSSIDWIGRVLNNTSGQEVLSWRTLRAKDSNTSQSIDWGNRRLTDNYGIVSADWSFGRRLLYDQYTSSSIDWENRATYDANGNRSVFWNNRHLYNSSGTVVVDWENQTNYDAANSVSIDWNSRQLIDSSGFASIDWESKQLSDTSSDGILFWDAVNNNYKITQYGFKEDYINLQHQENLSQAASDNERLNPAGESIVVGLNIDPTVATGDLVSLGEDGIWYQADQASSSGSAMLGICLNGYNKGQVFTEGTMTVVTGSGYTDIPFIDGTSFYGKPVYMREGVLGGLTTTPPTSGYIRIVGYLYYNNPTVTDYWLMKFRPSNDWYVI